MPSHSVRSYKVDRRLVAILFADVVNYSQLMGTDEEGTLAALMACRRDLIEPGIAAHRGRIVKYTGDGMLVRFDSPVEAVRCAVEVQRGIARRNTSMSPEKRLWLRIGINLGDVILQDADLHGDAVNIAARLEAFAQPGEVCISRAVRDQVRDKVPFSLEDMGEQRFKNIARPLHVYRVCESAPAASTVLSFPDAKAPLALPDNPSIAVLPFTNMSGDPGQEYFADGMVEEIITALARIRWLFVIARNSTFTYKGQAINIKQVGVELGVRYVLEGSVRKAGNDVRISAQLIDATNETHIWSDRFDGVLDNVFQLQDRIASGVAGVIEPHLQLAEIDRVSRKPPQNLSAYDLYLRARGEFHKHSDEGSRHAIDLAKRALEIDPDYAPAAALIGECWLTRGALGWGRVTAADREEIIRLAKQAIRLGKNDPDALWMAAVSLSAFSEEHALADSAIERALALNPNSAQAWNACGFIHFKQNNTEAAIEAQRRAIRLSPLDPLRGYFSTVLAQSYLSAERYEEALQAAEDCLYEMPSSISAMRTKTIACVQLGRLEEAYEARDHWLQLRPDETIASCKAAALKHLPPQILTVQIDGLRRAGLPEA